MTTVVYRIDAPPTGIEVTGDGTDPTEPQMAEETQAREKFLAAVSPYLAALPDRPVHHSGNVSKVELLGVDVWAAMNHYLLLLTVDIGDPRVDFDSFVPAGTEVTLINAFDPLAQWPAAPQR
ncbi:hypothetical protein [Kitasatospora sp. NPDC057223]|uniref:hypothetical protein n=1 Tax=Kitasatospora sp. NPDC057223 TaxID=3346055 RepID=UPI00362B9EC2